MARSRRKLNKFRTKVTRKPRRKTATRSTVPADVLEGNDTLVKKLGRSAKWNDQERFSLNYAANGLLADPQTLFGKNTGKRKQKEAQEDTLPSEHADSDTDDDLRQFEGKERHDGKRAEIRKLTKTQQRVVEGLIKAHGSDIQAMTMDRKLNKMLLPSSKLRKMVEAYESLGDTGRCQFRAPKKHG